MNNPVIYADFNGLQSSRHRKLSAIQLDTYGSLRDLTNQHVKLIEGMAIIVYADSAEGEDLEADGIVYYDPEGRCWMAEIDKDHIRYVSPHDGWKETEFLCFQCRQDLEPFFRENGRSLQTCCPNCGISIFTPVLEP